MPAVLCKTYTMLIIVYDTGGVYLIDASMLYVPFPQEVCEDQINEANVLEGEKLVV